MEVSEIRVDVFRDFNSNHVTMTHLPTGLRAECGEHRSELKNREQALRELQAKVNSLKPSLSGHLRIMELFPPRAK